MYTTEYVVRQFSKTPLKHCMSRYLLEKILGDEGLLERIVFVLDRANLPNTMYIAQAGVEGMGFELELGVVETEHISIVNDRLVKEKRKNRKIWTCDPVEAAEVLHTFKGTLHVQFAFVGEVPSWYQGQVVAPAPRTPPLMPGFAAFIRDQIDLALLGITLRHEIDEALKARNEELFREKVALYKQVCRSCFWRLS
ncbi:MAG TPA: hypothetical protein GX008_09390 [Firmicutes bacterium]|jgi:uncharacterized protein YpiB (UPF0302 family)|nr:MAG: hypothetical protein AA931_07005 [Peptococcaceae bacterium 1109]HHT73912.1 hypothetical protein [Bacillota bacterium]